MIVSPDAGGVERARAFAKRLDAGLAIVDKRRSAPNKAKAMAVIGDVNDKTAVILDDMIDTAGTLTEAVNALMERGAKEVHACCAHAGAVRTGRGSDQCLTHYQRRLHRYHPVEREGGGLQ